MKTGFKEVDDALEGGGLAYPAVMELVGQSGSGKTEFLLNVCAVNILPEQFQGVVFGGFLLPPPAPPPPCVSSFLHLHRVFV